MSGLYPPSGWLTGSHGMTHGQDIPLRLGDSLHWVYYTNPCSVGTNVINIVIYKLNIYTYIYRYRYIVWLSHVVINNYTYIYVILCAISKALSCFVLIKNLNNFDYFIIFWGYMTNHQSTVANLGDPAIMINNCKSTESLAHWSSESLKTYIHLKHPEAGKLAMTNFLTQTKELQSVPDTLAPE